MTQTVIELDVFVAPPYEVRIISIRLDEVRRRDLARDRRQETRHIETAGSIIDVEPPGDVHVMKYEIFDPSVVESSPRRDIAAQSQVKAVSALLLSHVDGVIGNAIHELEIFRYLVQEYIEIILTVPVRHQDGEPTHQCGTTANHSVTEEPNSSMPRVLAS